MLNESRKHRTKLQLLKCLAHIRKANRHLYLGEDHAELFRVYSNDTQSIYDNLLSLRAGIKETQEIISITLDKIERSMENPSAQPPPIRGAHLQTKLTRKQRDLNDRLGAKIEADFLPQTYKPRSDTDFSVPEIIIHTPYSSPIKKPRSRKKAGKLVI